MDPRIKKIGTILQTDSEGYLVSEASAFNIREPWRDVVDLYAEKFQQELGDNFHSLYIRGSIVRGTAVEGISDIDGIVLTKTDPSELDWSWRPPMRLEMLENFPFLTGVDFGQASVESVLNGQNKVRAFLLKVMSACVAGEDIIPLLPKVKPGSDALVVRWKFEEKIKPGYHAGPEFTLRHRTKHVGKQILRAGMELVMEREQAYSRDLYPCYEMVSKYYPEKESAMHRALEQALFSAETEREFERMRDDIGPWLADRLNELYPLKLKN